MGYPENVSGGDLVSVHKGCWSPNIALSNGRWANPNLREIGCATSRRCLQPCGRKIRFGIQAGTRTAADCRVSGSSPGRCRLRPGFVPVVLYFMAGGAAHKANGFADIRCGGDSFERDCNGCVVRAIRSLLGGYLLVDIVCRLRDIFL